jgi:hypothetical protein
MAGRFSRLLRNAAFIAAFSIPALADDGMWTFHKPPLDLLRSRHDVYLSEEWLNRLRLASVSIGSSGAFVSRYGLMVTNAHVALDCAKSLSTRERDLVKDGFLAHARAEELPCPGVEARQLVSYQDVTEIVTSARADERTKRIAAVEKECRDRIGLRCEVVSLHRGSEYWLYRYKVWSDVRLVFQPESDIAFFGQDTDNFAYPRYDMDVAFLRVYDYNQPLAAANFLPLARRGAAEGDLVFSSGNPQSTDRLLTYRELLLDRDQLYPLKISHAEDVRDTLASFGKRTPEADRRSRPALLGAENAVKVYKGESTALNAEALLARKRADEGALKARAQSEIAAGKFSWKAGDPWERIERAVDKQNARAFEAQALDYSSSTLVGVANHLVAIAMEGMRPDAARLKSYREAQVPRLRRQVAADAPWYKDLEAARLEQFIQEAMDLLGQSHPFVARLTGGLSPHDAAAKLIAGTRLDEGPERRRLLEGGHKAIEASTDPLLVAMRDLYPAWSALKRFAQDDIDAEKERAYDEIARLKHHLGGAGEAPDATGSLRVSFGKVAGYERNGVATPWVTTFAGLYERYAARKDHPDFQLPPRWKDSAAKLALSTPFNFATTLDIIGGSSGSPVVNVKGDLVGVLFDGNAEGLGNRFLYSDQGARSLAVDMRAVVEALDKVYGATELLRELNPPAPAAR